VIPINVDWGGTTLLQRAAAAGETLRTGRGSAAVLASGALLSGERWGAIDGFAAAVVTAADNYSAGQR